MEKGAIIALILALILALSAIFLLPKKTSYEEQCDESIEASWAFSKIVLAADLTKCEDELCTAAIKKDTKICESYNGTAKKSCLATVTQDPKYCEGNNNCQIFVTKEMYKQIKQKCPLSAVISKAIMQKNPEICKQAEDEQLCLQMMQKERFSVYDLL